MLVNWAMTVRRSTGAILVILFFFTGTVSAQQMGTIRGMIYDKDFDVPLGAAQVSIIETGDKITAADEGNFVFGEVLPGKYTLVFSKEGYTRQVKANVVVLAGQMTEVEASLSGEFTEMEEFVVQDLQITGTEAGLMMLRVESPSLLDSISSELISQAGAGDAASALKLVAGATVQDGKYAVIRGLPDRYVNSQMNNVRLPTADPDKRAVQLDQFPAGMIESVQVSKTFTPDQQGDASGGAVNIVLKGIPDEKVFQVKAGSNYNTQSPDANNFLTYKEGGVNFLGKDDGERDIPPGGDFENTEAKEDSAGVSRGKVPDNYNVAITAGGKHQVNYDVKVGGFASVYYKRYSSYHENGMDDSLWVEDADFGEGLTPEYSQGTPTQGDFKTSLFDKTDGVEELQWGGMGTLGIETKNHAVNVVYMYTRAAEDKVTLAENTRGKEYYFPGYDLNDPYHEGNLDDRNADGFNRETSPYLRTETLQYIERTTETLQFNGKHTLATPEIGLDGFFKILSPKVDWTLSRSSSGMYQPDKRQFGSQWFADSYNPGALPWVPPWIDEASYMTFKPSDKASYGNYHRIWKNVLEESVQHSVNFKFLFEQWSGEEGYVKIGVFEDKVNRSFNQDSFSNFNQSDTEFPGGWGDSFSAGFPTWESAWEVNDGSPTLLFDVDYKGQQKISAKYYMVDFPLTSWLKGIGGVRYENTELTIINDAEPFARWYDHASNSLPSLNPGDADVSFYQEDILPSQGFVFTPLEKIKLRGSYTETIARQTFKEITPIQQQEFLGGDVFIGNPKLTMSAVKNYDLRLDYTPYKGSLISFSWFRKDIDNPIEYVQRISDFKLTTAVNFPEGRLDGYEIETRHHLGHFWNSLDGLTIGYNATFIASKVMLPEDEVAIFADMGIPIESRDMLNAPEHLYNMFMIYDFDRTGTKFSLFYTVKGDTLVAGAGQSNGNFLPDIYAKEYGTLNLSLSQKIGKNFKFNFQAKNLFNTKIQEVYRSEYLGGDAVKSSYSKGTVFSLSLTGKW